MKVLRMLLWWHSWRLAVWAGRHGKARAQAFELRGDMTERHPVLIAKAHGAEKLAESLVRFHDNMAHAISSEIILQQRKEASGE